MYSRPPHPMGDFAATDIAALGIPTEEPYVAADCQRTRREGIPALDFYFEFNMIRHAAILHRVKGRLIRGNAASTNGQDLVPSRPKPSEIGWQQTKAA